MITLRAFTSALIVAAFVSGPAHAEMVSATKPPSKTESSKSKREAKSHDGKKKHASAGNADKKPAHEGAKASKEKPNAHHEKAKTAHAAKPAKKHEPAAAKVKPAHREGRPDKRVASRDPKKARHGSH